MEDLANYPGLKRRSNTWYVRKRVPLDIAEQYKSETVSRSLKTESLDEAKKLYHVQMLEFESDFDQKRKEKQHKEEKDQLSKFSEAALLGLAFEWYRETQGKVQTAKTKNIVTQYSKEEIENAIGDTRIEKQKYVDALQSNDFEIIYPTAQKWLEKKLISYDVNANAYDLFCHHLLKALIFSLDNDLKEYGGKTVAKTIPSIFDPVAHGYTPHTVGQPEPMLLTDLLDKFLDQTKRKDFTEKTNTHYKTIVILKHKVKIKDSEETRKCGFHSFRHNYRDALREGNSNRSSFTCLIGFAALNGDHYALLGIFQIIALKCNKLTLSKCSCKANQQ